MMTCTLDSHVNNDLCKLLFFEASRNASSTKHCVTSTFKTIVKFFHVVYTRGMVDDP